MFPSFPIIEEGSNSAVDAALMERGGLFSLDELDESRQDSDMLMLVSVNSSGRERTCSSDVSGI